MNFIKNKINSIKTLSPTVKSAMVYTFAGLFTRGLSIITVPIFTRLMSTAEIGTINVYNSWYAMLSVIGTLSLTSGGFMVAMKEYPNKRNEYTSSVLTITTLMAAIMTVVYILFPSYWNSFFNLPGDLVVLMLIGLYVGPARDFWLSKQRYEVKYKSVAIFTLGSAILGTGLSVIGVLIASQIHLGNIDRVRLYSNYIIVYGAAFVIFILLFIKGKTGFNKEYWSFSLKLSIPLIGNSLAGQVLSVSDRTMISSMVGKSAVGIYGTLYNVSSLSTIVWSSLNNSFVPYMFSNMETKEGRNKIKKYVNYILIAYAIVALGLTLLAPEVVRVLATDEYYAAIYIMPPIAAGIFLNALGNLYSNILLYYKKTQCIMIATSVAAVVNVLLNLICIPIYGYQAAAYTTLVSYVIMAIIESIVVLYVEKNELNGHFSSLYSNKLLFGICIVLIILCLMCNLIYESLLLRWGIVLGGVMITFICRKKIKRLISIIKNR